MSKFAGALGVAVAVSGVTEVLNVVAAGKAPTMNTCSTVLPSSWTCARQRPCAPLSGRVMSEYQ